MDGDSTDRPAAPEVTPTGDAELDGMLATLVTALDEPLERQVEQFEAMHARLSARLGDVEG